MSEMMKDWPAAAEIATDWMAPPITGEIKFGDMPGDKVSIGEEHIRKAGRIFPELLKLTAAAAADNSFPRAVIAVCGGSGVGKSEIASVLAHYFRAVGVGSYTLSGDNYPYRIPCYNDAERLRIFRHSGIRELVRQEVLTPERYLVIQELQRRDDDANERHIAEHPWFLAYLQGGISGLSRYLGTPEEIDFQELEAIVTGFKRGEECLWLKRMGRTETELWYDQVDFRNTGVLIIEWTHGNSDYFQGVDIPILLNSTPQETLAHRQARNRDGKTDSAFTMTVLKLEQEMLMRQAHKAKIIVSRQGELLSYEQYAGLMGLAEGAAG